MAMVMVMIDYKLFALLVTESAAIFLGFEHVLIGVMRQPIFFKASAVIQSKGFARLSSSHGTCTSSVQVVW